MAKCCSVSNAIYIVPLAGLLQGNRISRPRWGSVLFSDQKYRHTHTHTLETRNYSLWDRSVWYEWNGLQYLKITTKQKMPVTAAPKILLLPSHSQQTKLYTHTTYYIKSHTFRQIGIYSHFSDLQLVSENECVHLWWCIARWYCAYGHVDLSMT